MNELVQKLSTGEHKVVVGAVRDNPLEEFKAAVDRNYVHVKFTETRGGTELGFYLDDEHSDLSGADFDNGTGNAKVAGNLILDGVPVRCVADIDLAKMAGTGHLDIREEESAEEADGGGAEEATN